VLVSGFFSHLEIGRSIPGNARFLERLESFARLISFDKRGTGLSDRDVGLPYFETRMDDVRAVMDAAGSESAALLGYSEGCPMSILFAATYPERSAAPTTCPRSTTAASTSSRASTAGGVSSPFADGAPDDVARILGPCFGRCSSTSTSRCSGRDPSSARRDTSASARGTG
jgi:pimeloyl-ACP methyl ester carboxylesterase